MYTASTMFLPSKFMLCVFQLILLVILIVSYENYVYAAVDPSASSESSEYKSVRKSLIACIVVFLITLAAEFAAIFTAISVYFNRILAAQSVLHIFGCICTALLMEREWDGRTLWAIWAVFGLLPALLDGMSLFVLIMQGRQAKP